MVSFSRAAAFTVTISGYILHRGSLCLYPNITTVGSWRLMLLRGTLYADLTVRAAECFRYDRGTFWILWVQQHNVLVHNPCLVDTRVVFNHKQHQYSYVVRPNHVIDTAMSCNQPFAHKPKGHRHIWLNGSVCLCLSAYRFNGLVNS